MQPIIVVLSTRVPHTWTGVHRQLSEERCRGDGRTEYRLDRGYSAVSSVRFFLLLYETSPSTQGKSFPVCLRCILPGTNNARIAALLRSLASYYCKDSNALFVVSSSSPLNTRNCRNRLGHTPYVVYIYTYVYIYVCDVYICIYVTCI